MRTTQLHTVYEGRTCSIKLTEQQKQELLRFRSLIGSQNLTLHTDNRLLIKNFVGYIATPSLHIQILPKLMINTNYETKEQECIESAKLLFRMLHYSEFMSINTIPDPQHLNQMNGDLLEIFITIFIQQLELQIKRSPYRRYETFEDNAPFIKGKVLFQKQTLINRGLMHRHYQQQEEFTDNTLMNQIFKSILSVLLGKSSQSENRSRIKKLLLEMGHIDLIKLSGTLFNKITFNRMNSNYQPVFQLAKLFYQNQQPGVGKGEEHTFTFLIPLHELFEYTLYRALSNAFKQSAYKVLYQKPRKHLDIQRKWIYLKPDITIINKDNKSQVLAIIDAKYKLPVINDEWNPGTSDIYQMLAYAIRYHCDYIFMIYPILGEQKTAEQIGIEVGNREIKIKLLQVNLQTDNYDSLEKILKNKMHGVLEGLPANTVK